MKKAWVLSYPLSGTARTLIRLSGCPGWSEYLLGAHPFCWFWVIHWENGSAVHTFCDAKNESLEQPVHLRSLIWTYDAYVQNPSMMNNTPSNSNDPDQTAPLMTSLMYLSVRLCPTTFTVITLRVNILVLKFWSVIHVFSTYLKAQGWESNSVDPMLSAASDQGLHCSFRPVCLHT